jgi:hypothetical protein
VTFGLLLLGPALCDRRVGIWALLLLAGLFNVAYLDGVYNVLVSQETGTTDFYRAIRELAAHHALVRLDLAPWLVAEVLCLAVVLALAVEAVWRSAGTVAPLRAVRAALRPAAAAQHPDRLDRALP